MRQVNPTDLDPKYGCEHKITKAHTPLLHSPPLCLRQVNPADLDPKYGYIQVSFVTPYFEEKELQERVTDFERNNTLRRFMFETPFTKGSQAQGAIEEQYKRRTILVSELRFVVGFLSQNVDDFVLRCVRFCVCTAPFLHACLGSVLLLFRHLHAIFRVTPFLSVSCALLRFSVKTVMILFGDE